MSSLESKRRETGIEEVISKMNASAIQLDVEQNMELKYTLMNCFLYECIGKSCDVYLKNGLNISTARLKSFDDECLLLVGNFDEGYGYGIFKEMIILRSEVAFVHESTDWNLIHRLRERNNTTD